MNSILRTWWGQVLVAVLAVAGLELVIKLSPLLTQASIGGVLSREIMLIGWALALMLWLLRAGPISAAEMGWKRPSWSTLGFALLCLLASVLVSAAMILSMRSFGIIQNKEVLAAMGARPIWVLMLIALTAGISEEVLFRGVILNYIASASGKLWVGAVGSLAVFALLHAGGWGWSQVLFAAAPGAVLTAFFLWKRDLGVCIIGHFMVDALGLLGAWAQVHHG